ncbi:MAG TPA: division/cell wall cluster transcriptional repressor MraZ [Actinomycetota bacterium]|nr:division/cell wall cluster transcriptional repressor MraZ [Actinomycetota bacterium]
MSGTSNSFTGEFRHTIDAKGRLIVPSRMREALDGDRVVLTRWMDDCIAVWSEAGWREVETSLREQGRSNRNARALVRLIAASAHPDDVDRQGRITVPQHLREYAGITKDAVVIGALDHGEIWSPERWAAEQEHVEEGRLDQLAEGLTF